MAALEATARVSEEALAAATEETVIQLVAPANQRVVVKGFGIFFDGQTVGNEPVYIEIARQTTAGTASALTPAARDGSISETIQTSAQQDFTGEPTKGNVLESYNIHPQSGYGAYYPFESPIIIEGGGRLGLIATAPDAVNCTAWFVFEE